MWGGGRTGPAHVPGATKEWKQVGHISFSGHRPLLHASETGDGAADVKCRCRRPQLLTHGPSLLRSLLLDNSGVFLKPPDPRV